MMKNYIVRQLVTTGIASLLLTSNTVVLAEYKPPSSQRPPSGRTTIIGSRGGCETNRETSLKLLAPQKHVGQTASIYPTFVWLVSDAKPLSIEFKLYEYDGSGEPQLQQQFQMQSKYGIMTLTLPQNKLGLEVGKRYLWQVAILCDPKQPANDLVAMAEIDVVPMPAQLPFVPDARVNVDILAETGLWYDALSEALRLGRKDVVSRLLRDLAVLETIEPASTLTP